MALQNTIGKKVAETRASMDPPLSKKDFLRKLKVSGVELRLDELTALEAGELTLNYYQMTTVASVLNTTFQNLIS